MMVWMVNPTLRMIRRISSREFRSIELLRLDRRFSYVDRCVPILYGAHLFLFGNKFVSLRAKFLILKYGYITGDNFGCCAGTYGVSARLK